MAFRALVIVLLVAGSVAAHAGRDPLVDLAEGKLAYLRHDYGEVEARLRPLLYPTVELSSEDAVLEARRLLALSCFFQKKMPEARNEVISILAIKPTYELNRYVDPPVAVSFFSNIRKEQDQRLADIRRRELEDEEERRRQAEEDRHRLAAGTRIVVEKITERHSRALAMLPFGIGQWQNGQRKKAIFFATAELTLGVLSLAMWVTTAVRFPNAANNTVSDVALSRGLYYTQVSSGAAFWGLVAAGIIDAQVKYVPDIVSTRPAAVSVAPVIGGGLFGLAVQGAF